MSTASSALIFLMLVHFLTLNAQGFRSPDKQREIMHYARARNVDILFLQECNFHTPRDISLFREKFAVQAFFSLSDSLASGVGVVFLRDCLRNRAFCTFGLDGRTLAVDFHLSSRRVRAVVVYAPTRRNYKADFYSSLDAYLLEQYPTMLVGDFNCVLDPQRDVRGPGQGRPYQGAGELRSLVTQFRLQDAWELVHGDEFAATWARGRSASRLDKFYLPPQLSRHVNTCDVLSFPTDCPRISDHRPVSLTLSFEDCVPRCDLWRMDKCLLTDPASSASIGAALAAEVVSEASSTTWDELKARFRGLLVRAGRERKVRITEELNDTLRRLRIVNKGAPLTFAMRDYASQLKARYVLLLRLSSRAASETVVLGRPVSNPAVLRHVRTGSADQTRSHVPNVTMPDGSVSDMQEDIGSVFTQYVSEQFTSERGSRGGPDYEERLREFCDGVPRVPEHLLEQFCAPATARELEDTLDAMNEQSAPGPDGIQTGFYRVFFPIIKKALLEMINAFIVDGVRPESFRESRVVLIPKPGGDPSDPKAYRPITLLNSDYKIAASILARRVSATLPEIVSESQNCSVPGRSIFSSLALTRDLFTYATRTGISGCFVSVDQAKAFDRVEHHYLLGVLKCYGFPAEFVARLELMYTGVSARLLVNGKLSAPFVVSRGIRQGCCLSPLLFALCIDPLLRCVTECPNIRGFPLPGQGQVKTTAYADDVSLFLRGRDSFAAFLQVFGAYSELSGAQLNGGKSRAMRFGSFASDLPGGVEWVEGVRVLGVIFHPSGDVANRTWRELLENAERRLSIAAQYQLPLSERGYVIKSCVSAALFYAARVACPPTRVMRQLNTRFGAFFWAGKTERVARVFLRLPKSMGGFSIPCVTTMCSILALRGVLDLVHDRDFPGGALVKYFLGTSRRLFYRELGVGPSAEQPPHFYTYVIGTYTKLREQLSGSEIAGTQPTKICERLAVGQLSDVQLGRARGARWKQLTSSVLPSDVRDFGWERGWGVLPTRDRLASWGVVPNSRCPQCGQVETLKHAMYDCRVARTFWRLLGRQFRVRLGARTKTRDALITFLLCVGALVLWRRRGYASLTARPQRAMYPMLWKVRARLAEHLEAELSALGEAAFLRRWSTRFITVRNQRVHMEIVPY